MSIAMLIVIGLGAVLGAWLRWGVVYLFESVLTQFSLGTLVVNLIGGYLVGLAVAFFAYHATLSAEWRMFVIVGFLGSLTTFSAFSMELAELLIKEQFAWVSFVVLAHVVGSVLMTLLGMQTWRYFQA